MQSEASQMSDLSGIDPEGRNKNQRRVLRFVSRSLSAKFHAKGRGVKAKEEERWFNRTVGRADLQLPGRDGLLFTRRTPSRMIVWYPRFGEGQDGVAHFVSNKTRNA